MSCETCIVHRGKFKSCDEFKLVKEKINYLLQSNKMETLGDFDLTSPYFVFAYKCLNCGQVWKLSYPDQAYRGAYEEIKGYD